MSKISDPNATLLLLSEAALSGKGAPSLAALRKQLGKLAGLADFQLDQHGESTVELTVPARNGWERDRIKALVDTRVDGWKVIEHQSYALPKSL